MKIMRCWDKGRNTVRVLLRNTETHKLNTVDVKFNWYFYVDNETFNKENVLFQKLKEGNLISGYKKESYYTKIYVDREHNSESLDINNEMCWDYNEYHIKKLKDKLEEFHVQTYEMDVPLWKRWMIDQNVEIEKEYRVVMLDIETDDSNLNSKITPGEFMILSCAFTDMQTGDKSWFCAKDKTEEAEKEFLIKVARVLSSYDVIAAFNGGNFDEPYIKARFKKYNIVLDWRKKFWQDSLYIFKKIGPNLPSYSLEEISMKILGEGKLKHSEKIVEMFDDNKQKLKQYNIQDTWLMYLLEQKTQLLETAREVNIIGCCFVDDKYISRKIDTLVLKKAHELGCYHFKTKLKYVKNDEDDDSYEGAHVVKPILGMHEDVIVVDFSSLYPSIVKTLNCSPDTLITDPDIEHTSSPNGYMFRKDRIGILPSIISMTAERRGYYKKLMKTVEPGSDEYKLYDKLQYVFKYFGLSFYGVVGMQGSRFYDKRIAETITLTGQFMIKGIGQYLNKINYNILYGDSDSLMFNGVGSKSDIPIIITNINKLCHKISKEKFNSDNNFLEMAYDKHFTRWVIVAKKRYAGILYSLEGKILDEPTLYVAGLEYKRTDNCRIVRETQKELLLRLLNNDRCSILELSNWLYGLKQQCNSRSLQLDDIVFAQKLTKDIDEYKADMPHLKVAREMQLDKKEVWIGDKIKYIVVATDSKGKAIPIPEYKYSGVYDMVYYWNKKIYKPLLRILEVVYKNENWDRFFIRIPKGSSKNTVIGRSLWDIK